MQSGPPISDRDEARAPRTYVPLLVLAGSLLLTGLTAYQVDRSAKTAERMHLQALLDDAAREVRDRIAQRREAYVAILHGTGGLFAGNRYVPPAVFSEYVRGLKLQQAYPGVVGIGIIVRTSAAERPKVEQYLESAGRIPARVWPEDPPREIYYPILHLETVDPADHAALGFDPYTDAIRRAAMERARDEGTAALSAKLRLDDEMDPRVSQHDGFVMYYPIYSSGNEPTPTTADDRRQRLVAFVYSPFRPEDFLRGTFPQGRETQLDFDLYDGTETTPEHLLTRAPEMFRAAGRPARRPLTVDMGGRTWTLAFWTAQPAPPTSGVSRSAVGVLAAGGAISLLLFALTRSQWEARRVAERSTAEVRAAAEVLRQREKERVGLLAAEQEARGEAEAANRSKDEFLATLSHELRTPLNAILGWAQLLRMGVLPADEAAQGLETIERNAKAQAQLVDDLLDLSRIISGRLKVETRPVNLVALVEGALDSVRPAAEAKRINVVPVLDAHAGPVVGDAGRLQQVAWNLLSNAIKFTPRGGRVDVWLCGTASEVEITVSDNGAGIAPEFLPHVFDRLRQADGSSTRRHGGLGLGLAIVRHLIELHGGTVSAASAGVGRGATFTIRLPLSSPRRAFTSREHESTSRTPSDAADNRSDSTTGMLLHGVKVLVVDDERDARELLRLGLEQRGAAVTVAASAAEALAAVRIADPMFDILLSDIGMPEEDGYALIRRVRELGANRGGDVPAVALTAYARAEDRDRAIDAGFHEHVAKPVEPARLGVVVAKLLNEKRRRERVGMDSVRL